LALDVLKLTAGQACLFVPERRNPSQMLGWMMVFALIAILAGTLSVTAGPAAALISAKFATFIFGALFLVCLLTSIVRRRA
jgi:uncharacterized membrane protein YtjA (UPF0391 family)